MDESRNLLASITKWGASSHCLRLGLTHDQLDAIPDDFNRVTISGRADGTLRLRFDRIGQYTIQRQAGNKRSAAIIQANAADFGFVSEPVRQVWVPGAVSGSGGALTVGPFPSQFIKHEGLGQAGAPAKPAAPLLHVETTVKPGEGVQEKISLDANLRALLFHKKRMEAAAEAIGAEFTIVDGQVKVLL